LANASSAVLFMLFPGLQEEALGGSADRVHCLKSQPGNRQHNNISILQLLQQVWGLLKQRLLRCR
jgi:hypothetical protein